MGRRKKAGSRWERWLGEGDSWRRVVSAGIAGGIVLAMLAALIGSMIGGGSGSIDDPRPTFVVPAPVVADDTEPVPPPDIAEPTATNVLAEDPTPTAVGTVEPTPTLPSATETMVLSTPEATSAATKPQ